MKRNGRRFIGVGGVVVFAWLVTLVPAMPPSLLMFRSMPTLGRDNTDANHGYESPQHVSPILPTSFVARVGPRQVGVQFVGDSRSNLEHDHFALKITPSSNPGWLKPNLYQTGFVGWRLSRPLGPGTHHVTFRLTGFNMAPPTWTITVTGKPPYTLPREGANNRALLDSLNTIRQSLHLQPVIYQASLAAAAQAHANYLDLNGYAAPSFHMESPGHPGYTGKTPWARDMSFGWPTPLSGEVGMEWAYPSQSVTVVQDLIDTIYHRLSLLSGNLTSAGAAMISGNNGSVVMDLGFGYRSSLPLAIVYPYAEEPGVPTSWVDIESPDPVSGGYQKVFGYPITADFPTVDTLKDVRVHLTQGSSEVAYVLDAPGVGNMAFNQLGLVPKDPLKADSLYQVAISALAAFNDGSVRPLKISWSFATGGAGQSVAVSVKSSRQAEIACLRAGSGQPLADQMITVYRRGPTGHLTVMARGATNSQGLFTATRPRDSAGSNYEAVSNTGNAAIFWWGKHGDGFRG